MPTLFNLIPEKMSFQLIHSIPLVIRHQDTLVMFTLWTENIEFKDRDV